MKKKRFDELVGDAMEAMAIVVGYVLAVLGATWAMQWLLSL